MNENVKYIAAAVGVVGLSIGAVVYISMRKHSAPAPAKPVAAMPAPPAVAEEPPIKHPLPEPATPEPLPPLNESDEQAQTALAGLIGPESVERFVITKD